MSIRLSIDWLGGHFPLPLSFSLYQVYPLRDHPLCNGGLPWRVGVLWSAHWPKGRHVRKNSNVLVFCRVARRFFKTTFHPTFNYCKMLFWSIHRGLLFYLPCSGTVRREIAKLTRSREFPLKITWIYTKNTENSSFIMKGYVDSVSAQIEICWMGWSYVTPPSWKSRGYHANPDIFSDNRIPHNIHSKSQLHSII